MTAVEGPSRDEPGRDDDVRRYAAGERTWPDLQRAGWESFGDVLAALGRLGLRYPALSDGDGSNAERRARDRAYFRSLLKGAGD